MSHAANMNYIAPLSPELAAPFQFKSSKTDAASTISEGLAQFHLQPQAQAQSYSQYPYQPQTQPQPQSQQHNYGMMSQPSPQTNYGLTSQTQNNYGLTSQTQVFSRPQSNYGLMSVGNPNPTSEQRPTTYGTYTYADGSSYTGEWENSKRSGFGTVYANFNRYDGFWRDDSKHGYGISIADGCVSLNYYHYGMKIAMRILSEPKPDDALSQSEKWRALCERDSSHVKSILSILEEQYMSWMTVFNTTSYEKNAVDIFNDLDTIMQKHADPKKLSNDGHKLIQSFLMKCIDQKVSWATLFYGKMVKTRTLTSSNEYKYYSTLLTTYVNANKKNTALPAAIFSAALDFHCFLVSHEQDVDNSIIGLDLSEEALLNISRYNEKKSQPELRIGDILVVELTSIYNKRKIFARYTGRIVREDSIEVFISPDERSTAIVELGSVYRLSADIKSQLGYGSYRSMERLVNPPVKACIDQMLQEAKMRVFFFYSTINISTELLKKASSNELSISDLKDILTAKRVINEILDSKSTTPEKIQFDNFIKDFVSQMNARREEFFEKERKLANLGNFFTLNYVAFAPTQAQLEQELKTLNLAAHIMSRVTSQSRAIDVALQELEMLKREYTSGVKKKNLTEWWLVLIKEEVNKFLDSIGYVSDAVPDNYTDHPPASMAAVKKNLTLLQNVLNTQVDVYHVKQMLARISDAVYPVIEDFINQLLIIIADGLGEAPDYFEKKSTQEVEAIVKAKVQALPEEKRNRHWAIELLKDVTYLREMKEREHKDVGNSLDVIPISGLVIGRFARLQNEIKTVIEIWDK